MDIGEELRVIVIEEEGLELEPVEVDATPQRLTTGATQE